MTTEGENQILDAAESAEAVRDPLEGIIERTAIDAGAPFAPDVLERLISLKKENLSAFESLRSKLKKAGCRITVLDKALAEESGDTGRPSQADTLIELADEAELFHAPDKTGYADVTVNGHRETWQIRGGDFRRWIGRRYYEATRGAPNAEALQSAMNVLESKAQFDGIERTVFVRVGEYEGKIYLDLSDASWRAVEIDERGWRVMEAPPVRFRRSRGMQPLPVPETGGKIDDLKPFLNIKNDADFVLAVAWILSALRPRGPYPVLVISGEQGSAKSSFAAFLRSLLDPNTASLRALPREERDLFIAANNAHVLGFDNVSGLLSWVSDALCRLSTGGGYATRQLHTDQDEMLFDATRPIILNGIEDMVTRPDLADRSLFLLLEAIPDEKRKPEQKLKAEFQAALPKILGVLLDAGAHGLRTLPDTKLERMPRMADFALWATACERAIFEKDSFWKSYCANLGEAVDNVIEADPVATAVRTLMSQKPEWIGTASDLLKALNALVDDTVKNDRQWPTAPNKLSGRLRRAATFLRKTGIDIAFDEKQGRVRSRILHITAKTESGGNLSPVSSASPMTDGADDADDKYPTHSESWKVAI